ncbi:MAG: AAA family ATPase, partial [Deltaproteobacteria bacterium]|nr:AAA family ATPase [Deltaproteobacteria bacterium]
ARARAGVEALRDAPLVGPRGPMSLTDEQEAAVLSMATDRTVVLTGGPGTGKTSVVVSLLRVLARRAYAEGGEAALSREVRLVALAAPTGKAADRLGEAVRTALARSSDPIDALLDRHLESPRTIHRLLGYRHRVGRSARGTESSFRAHRHNPLAERLVLVDEVSMIDTVLFERLLSAVSPEASLVLLGDPDQLPSVDPGAVLRDLLTASPPSVRVSRLTKSHRMDPSDPDGAHVLSVARACLSTEAVAPPFRRSRAEDRETVVGRGGAWQLDAPELPGVLDAWIARHLLVPALASLDGVDVGATDEAPEPVRAALAQLSLARILTVTRRAAEDLDAYVSASFARWRGEPQRARRVLPGEPVMVVHNDYDADLWNGDAGVAWRDRGGETLVSFRRGTGVRTRPLAAVAHLVERSHAVTVHKAQGSEHDEILFVMPPVDTALSSREIVYTAITRARRSAIVVARPELLEVALRRASTRETGLVEALSGHGG